MLKMTRAAMQGVVLAAAIALTVPAFLDAQAQSSPPATSPAPPASPAATADPGKVNAPAAPVAPAPAKASDVAKTTETVENPYGLEALWKGGDLVARITLGILVIMSIGSWYIIITKVYEQAKMGA